MTPVQKKKMTLAETRKSLPVYGFREQFLQAVEENQVLIICGETGSGKTTQLPQYLYEAVSFLFVLFTFVFRMSNTAMFRVIARTTSELDAHSLVVLLQWVSPLVLLKKWDANWDRMLATLFVLKTAHRSERKSSTWLMVCYCVSSWPSQIWDHIGNFYIFYHLVDRSSCFVINLIISIFLV